MGTETNKRTWGKTIGLIVVGSMLFGCALPGAGSTAAASSASELRANALMARMAEATEAHAIGEAADGRYLAQVPEAALVARFGEEAVVEHEGASIEMRFTEIGRGEERASLPSAEAEVEGAFGVELERGAVREWWRSGPAGLEFGADVAERPEGEGELSLLLSVRGAEVSGEGHELSLGDGLRVGELFVRDAEGTLLPSRMEATPEGILLLVEDEGAAYPLVVDPLISEGAAGDTPSWGWGCAYGAPSAMCAEAPER